MSFDDSLLGDYLTPARLADELAITTKTLNRWEAIGAAPPRTKLGKRVYYARSAVIAWLKAREQKAGSKYA